MSSITFETKCYENDWEYILKGHYLEKMISRCGIHFDFKQLIINNVKDKDVIKHFADKKVEQGVIDEYFFTDDSSDEVLSFFNLSKESLGKGYVYSISELTGIYKCKTDYLLHFASDAFLTKKAMHSKWIIQAIEKMNSEESYIIANPVWNFLYNDAKRDSIKNDDDFYISQGCSDQCYLIKVNKFRLPIYFYKHEISNYVYPKYGGELFEKRVDAYLRNTQQFRLIYKKASYIHGNFPKSKIKRIIYSFISQKLHFSFTLLFRNPSLPIILYKIFNSKINYFKSCLKRRTR